MIIPIEEDLQTVVHELHTVQEYHCEISKTNTKAMAFKIKLKSKIVIEAACLQLKLYKMVAVPTLLYEGETM